MHRLEILDYILKREDSLRAFTAMSKEFGTLVVEFSEAVARLRGTPLFKGDPRHRRRARNRCRLDMRHALPLSLVQKRAHMPQDILAGFFGTDQSTVSRKLGLYGRVLEKILPTAGPSWRGPPRAAAISTEAAPEQGEPDDRRGCHPLI